MELIALVTERPYVVAFLTTFVVVAWAERGPLRMALWLVTGTFLGWLMEFSSVRTGFPFGAYAYRPAQFPDELWLGDVPLFASLSFAFLTYFGYSVARTLLSPLELLPRDLVRRDEPGLDGSLRLLALAALLTTWVDTVIDPVTHLGRYWFLGDLYAYEGGGLHFDVPLTNYAGWLFTSLCIVFVNQRLDVLLREAGWPARGFALPYRPLWALGALVGNFVFMLGITVYLMTAADVPASEPLAGILASGLALSAAFLILAVAVIAGRLRAGEPRPAEPLRGVGEPALR